MTYGLWWKGLGLLQEVGLVGGGEDDITLHKTARIELCALQGCRLLEVRLVGGGEGETSFRVQLTGSRACGRWGRPGETSYQGETYRKYGL